MDAVHVTLATTPSAMDIHRMGSVKDVSLYTSFIFTPRSPKEEPKTQTSSWSELPLIMKPIVKNNKPSTSRQALQPELNYELFTDNSLFLPGRLIAVTTNRQYCLPTKP